MDATPFGHYQLQQLIGRGGMGEVYRAYDTKTDRIVALKLLPPHMAADETFQQRFRRESQAAAGLNDPHVVPIHGFGEIDGRLYLDMRLIEGSNLGTILEDSEGTPLEPAYAVNMVEQVATALDAAHEAGLIHRDVKPSNILITPREFVYLIDFGLARTTGDKGLTTAGSTLGTMSYMAPERFEAGQVDPRSDIYALTCVLYECLTGERPYPADSLEQQIAGHMTAPVPRPSAINPKLKAYRRSHRQGHGEEAGEAVSDGWRVGRCGAAGAECAGARDGSQWAAFGAAGAASVAGVAAGDGGDGRGGAGGRTGHVRGVAVARRAWARYAGGERGGEFAATPTPAPGAVESIAATVPEEIRSTGRLVIGVNVPYPPNEFKDSSGQIVGFDVDLMNAVARTLGLVPEYRETAFEAIIPSVRAGDFNVGMSSFTDTKEREGSADFVTYFQAGFLWAQKVGGGDRSERRVRAPGRGAVRRASGDGGDPGEEPGV